MIAKCSVCVLAVVLIVTNPPGVFTQRRPYSPCDESSCYPATGDLLIGRESRLKASSTCGLRSTERYCIVSHLEDESNKCFVCDSRREYSNTNKISHRVENVVSTFRRDWKLRWWQAQNGLQGVSIQLDLEAEFHFTHLILRFKTFRPAAMLIERSYDFGKTWKVYRYFAHDCEESFPRISVAPITRIQDVICESKYSDVAPSSEGEVIFRVLPSNVEIQDPYSEEVQDLLKMTNLRVNFTKLHTLGDNLLDSRDQIKEKYYYSVYSMVVRGSCSCYGHASRCLPLPDQEDLPNMVHGRCECKHNTKGLNCEQCDDFYNDLPWRPARGRETNACKMCECNQHATRCHFDPAVYEATGRVSGGVCDDCQHNTMGHHCEECKPFFYHDPNRLISDPYVCTQCDCDPVGSEHEGECEGRSDRLLGLVAGRCLCKRFVEGRRCDSCIDQYWNMRVENPDGCEPCGCYSLGTVGNLACDKTTGECRCKRYVVGRQCDKCLEGYWGMSDDPQGCRLCDCDIGGAYNMDCDQRSGQCNCRPNIEGRRCDQIRHSHFVMSLDWLLYEAEDARGTGNTQEVVREVVHGRPSSWTGRGFMRVYEGATLEFIIDNIPHSMEYDFVIRYETQMPQTWDDVRLEIVRPGRVDQHGACANHIPRDDRKAFNLNQGAQQHIVRPSSCLEKGVRYIARLVFSRYRSQQHNPEANILVDSIVLMSSSVGHPLMESDNPNSIKLDFERYRCRDHHISAVHTPMSDACRRMIFSSSASIYDGASACECDPVGSESPVCNQFGGQCRCKPNVIGRRCDKCAPGYFNFGPAGCSSCNCSPVGARGSVCDPVTGQCRCQPNTHGQRCDRCERGYFGFPNCRQCQCSGRADECDSETGICLSCRDFTGGDSCERCADGYYGNPRPGYPSGCQPCLCPGGQGSGMQHADTCRLDTRSDVTQVICDCKRGYAGANCNRCADNFFGNPNIPGGTCEPCTCNNNIDFSLPGSCDPVTGQCLKCLYNTEGPQCERCKTGFYGDARRQNCRPCVCNILGTHRASVRTCHPVTGQCQCLPHVTGQDCGSCEPNHWKLASGEGCEPCYCDRSGSVSSQCNEYDGQCECLPGRGGRDCSSCEDLFWGDPRSQCLPCNCDSHGSTGLQCNRQTGQCDCAPGVAGVRCDRCARGTSGVLPHCLPCGECFDNWDVIISELKSVVKILVQEGSELKHSGASEAFEAEFQEMERKLEEVESILSEAGTSTGGLDVIQRRIQIIRQNLTRSSSQLDRVDSQSRDTSIRIEIVNNRIDSISNRIEALSKSAHGLKDNATKIQEQDVTGALNSVRESYNRSVAAQRRVDLTSDGVHRSKLVRNQVDEVIRTRRAEFERQLGTNEKSIQNLDVAVTGIGQSVVDLNQIVCGGRGNPCDAACGGAGCGKCGGISCGESSVSKSTNAVEFSQRADLLLKEKQSQTEAALSQIESSRDSCNMAASDARMAYDQAQSAMNESKSALFGLQSLLKRISDAMNQGSARPSEVRRMAVEVLAMSISLTPQEILDLERQITDAIRGLTNIEDILRATRGIMTEAFELKRKADATKSSADAVLEIANRTRGLLNKAKEAQTAADKSIADADKGISDAEANLVDIDSSTTRIEITSGGMRTRVNDFRNRTAALRQKFMENEISVDRAFGAAESAEILANQADNRATELDENYSEMSENLEEKSRETKSAKERAGLLKQRASQMFESISSKHRNLQDWSQAFKKKEEHLLSIVAQIGDKNNEMVLLLSDIMEAANFLRTCGTA